MDTMIMCSKSCKYQINGVCSYNTTLVNRAYNGYCVTKSEKSDGAKNPDNSHTDYKSIPYICQ